MQYNDWKYSAIQQKMKAYVGWVSRTQRQIDPHGFDARVNPKFQLPNGQIYRGTTNTNRPQTDGVGARACNLLLYTQILLDHGDTYEALTNIVPLIKYDLDWILLNWQSKSYCAASSILSDDFFWNRAGFVDALSLCIQVFTRLNDLPYAEKCLSLKQIIRQTLDKHWTGSYIAQYNSQKYSLVLHALSSYDIYPKTDDRIAKTIDVLAKLFCVMFRVNQIDNQPGILLGLKLGGQENISPHYTGVLAKLLYQKANYVLTYGFVNEQDKKTWEKLFKISINSSNLQIAQAAVYAGDSVLNRLYKYVKNDDGMISYQINKLNTSQKTWKYYSWAYANILTALKQRRKCLQTIESFKQLRQE